MESKWVTAVGEVVTRAELRALYGGAPFGGIEASAKTPNVFVFMDPVQAKANGYVFDGWTADGALLYTGEGRLGDQLMKDGNKALLEHVQQGRSLRVFTEVGKKGPKSNEKVHSYLGEFRIDDPAPFTVQEALDPDEVLRTVFVFKLWPLEQVAAHPGFPSSTGEPMPTTTVAQVPLETDGTFTFPTQGSAPSTAEKREAKLVARYKKFRGPAGASLVRYKIRPAGELADLLTDVFDPSTHTLFEAKGTATRNSIRLAVGQLLDYRRHIPEDVQHLALLLPHRPSQDLCNLIHSLEMTLVYEVEGGAFVTEKS